MVTIKFRLFFPHCPHLFIVRIGFIDRSSVTLNLLVSASFFLSDLVFLCRPARLIVSLSLSG